MLLALCSAGKLTTWLESVSRLLFARCSARPCCGLFVRVALSIFPPAYSSLAQDQLKAGWGEISTPSDRGMKLMSHGMKDSWVEQQPAAKVRADAGTW